MTTKNFEKNGKVYSYQFGYNFDVISYEEDPLTTIETDKKVKNFAFIKHDMDKWEEDTEDHKIGEFKKPHYHIILNLATQDTAVNVGKRYNGRAEICHNLTKSIQYLVHKNNEEKYQYQVAEVIYNNIEWFEKHFYETSSNKVYRMVEEMMNGKSFRELCEEYGRDFIYHWKDIRECACILFYQEHNYVKVMELANSMKSFDKLIEDIFEKMKKEKEKNDIVQCAIESNERLENYEN